jgi:hypothetical protein
MGEGDWGWDKPQGPQGLYVRALQLMKANDEGYRSVCIEG